MQDRWADMLNGKQNDEEKPEGVGKEGNENVSVTKSRNSLKQGKKIMRGSLGGALLDCH